MLCPYDRKIIDASRVGFSFLSNSYFISFVCKDLHHKYFS